MEERADRGGGQREKRRRKRRKLNYTNRKESCVEAQVEVEVVVVG